MNKRPISMGICIVLFFLFIALIMILGNNTSKSETRAGETYLGDPPYNCICHAQIIYDWSETDHADADGDFMNMNGTNMYNDSYCGPCHVLGWNEISSEGFDPGQAWNSTYNQDRWTIQCENCHGPASAHTSSPSTQGTINVDRDPYTACGGNEYARCHSGPYQFGTEDIPGWNSSQHAPFDNPQDDYALNTYCAKCKSPSQWDPDASYSDNEDIPWEEYRGITCADCHDPHKVTEFDYQLRWDPDTICENCHYGNHHETMRSETFEGKPSVNREDYPYMEEVNCIDCHMWDSPEETPIEYAVNGHSFEPRIEACVDCHTDVYESMPDSSDPQSEWDLWYAELDNALMEWNNTVVEKQIIFDSLYAEVDVLFNEAEDLKDTAELNGFWNQELDEAFDQIEYDLKLADHQSRGAHNPQYALALLSSVKENTSLIIEELNQGILQGLVIDSLGSVEDAQITVNGNTITTDLGGFYSFTLKPGTYNVTAFRQGIINETRFNVTIEASSWAWVMFEIDNDFDNDGLRDFEDPDDDNDGFPNDIDAFPLNSFEWMDTDSDGIGDNTDLDDDGDGISDYDDDFPLNPREWKDSDDDGIGDNSDNDNNNNQVPDFLEIPLGLSILVIPIIIFILLNKRIKRKKEEKAEEESKE